MSAVADLCYRKRPKELRLDWDETKACCGVRLQPNYLKGSAVGSKCGKDTFRRSCRPTELSTDKQTDMARGTASKARNANKQLMWPV